MVAAILNAIFLIFTGSIAIANMEQTKDRVDDASSSMSATKADTVFGWGEILCAVGELAASAAFAWHSRQHKNFGYLLVAVFSNWVGWVAVYALGLWSVATDGTYNTKATQLIFHFAMMVMMWALNDSVFDAPLEPKEAETATEDEVDVENV